MSVFRRRLADTCIIFTISMALLAGGEGAARIAREVKASVDAPPDSPEFAILRTQPWGRQQWIDQRGASAVHEAYFEFRDRPYRSQTLNIDNKGRRLVPGNCEQEGALDVLTFGGSTMYGFGVPDEFTIPAYLAALYNGEGKCVRVTNYGSEWWQSSQSLIQLIEVLKKGTRPRVVIFYDGINEVDAVADGGRPGGIDPRAEDLLKKSLEPEARDLLRGIARNSMLVRAVRRYLPPAQNDEDAAGRSLGGAERRPAVRAGTCPHRPARKRRAQFRSHCLP